MRNRRSVSKANENRGLWYQCGYWRHLWGAKPFTWSLHPSNLLPNSNSIVGAHGLDDSCQGLVSFAAARAGQGRTNFCFSSLYSSSGTVFILTLLPPPPHLNMAGIRTLKFVSASFEKRNPKGSLFVGTFEKVVRSVQILSAFLKKKNPKSPFQKSAILSEVVRGGGGGVVVVD